MAQSSAYQTALEISKRPFFVKKNILYKKSFSLSYLFYRILRPLLKLNYKIFKLFNPQSPWTSQASIKTFERILHNNMIGFECGSGFSTVFFSKYLKQLTSVEHNEEWSNIVRTKLKDKGITNVDYHFIPSKKESSTREYSFYKDYNLTSKDFTIRKEYHDYFSFVSTFPNEHFDFIIVDGRARVECCLNAIPKLKEGGLFVLDNSDRDRYKPISKVLENWQRITTTTGLFDTTIWFKP
ncbi:MAG: class I SAM-dependent methyltransferase [Bacteroidia bacterium]|nr:class I SAM-dependent methyltransferase [Bacteroidia bacterium]